MIELKYYTLDHAAKKIGCLKEDLIQLAADDELSLYVKGNYPAMRFDSSQDDEYWKLTYKNLGNPNFTHPRVTGTKCLTPDICKIPAWMIEATQTFADHPPHTDTLHDAIKPNIFYKFDRKIPLENFNWFISKEDIARLLAKEPNHPSTQSPKTLAEPSTPKRRIEVLKRFIAEHQANGQNFNDVYFGDELWEKLKQKDSDLFKGKSSLIKTFMTFPEVKELISVKHKSRGIKARK